VKVILPLALTNINSLLHQELNRRPYNLSVRQLLSSAHLCFKTHFLKVGNYIGRHGYWDSELIFLIGHVPFSFCAFTYMFYGMGI